MGHVFISYSRKNQEYARKLAKDLRASGIEPWNDEDIEHGARWWPTIVEAIQDCTAFVVVMTTESDVSEWVLKEIMLADREEKLILPLLLSGKGHAYLIDRQYEDVTGGRMPPKAFFDQLRRALPAPEPEAEPSVGDWEDPFLRPPPAKAEAPRAGFEPELVRIPAGPFLMGSNEGPDNEQPQHTVELSAYWIGKYPVTNAEYQVFVLKAGHHSPNHWDGDAYPEGKGDHPVVYVSWEDATAYCTWLSEKTGKNYRLLAEAQWEKAARTDDGRIYPWGNDWDAARLNSDQGKRGDTSSVGQYSPDGDSPYGCADMAGNVWEWCADWFDKVEYKRRVDGAVVDPEGPQKGEHRVLRGGTFNDYINNVRCAARNNENPLKSNYHVGFRIVLLP